VAQAGQLVQLLQLPRLCKLLLVGSPLAARCWSGRDPIKVTQQGSDCGTCTAVTPVDHCFFDCSTCCK
jgi:hypothetical protein